MKGGRQEVSLPGTFENYCFQPGSIVHELFHALGFWHEHTREDRDEYIEILWDNMHSNCKTQFEIQKPQMLVGDYDYASAMHYRSVKTVQFLKNHTYSRTC